VPTEAGEYPDPPQTTAGMSQRSARLRPAAFSEAIYWVFTRRRADLRSLVPPNPEKLRARPPNRAPATKAGVSYGWELRKAARRSSSCRRVSSAAGGFVRLLHRTLPAVDRAHRPGCSRRRRPGVHGLAPEGVRALQVGPGGVASAALSLMAPPHVRLPSAHGPAGATRIWSIDDDRRGLCCSLRGQDSATCWPGRWTAMSEWRRWASTTASGTPSSWRRARGCARALLDGFASGAGG
jgi:hypothetical protein